MTETEPTWVGWKRIDFPVDGAPYTEVARVKGRYVAEVLHDLYGDYGHLIPDQYHARKGTISVRRMIPETDMRDPEPEDGRILDFALIYFHDPVQ